MNLVLAAAASGERMPETPTELWAPYLWALAITIVYDLAERRIGTGTFRIIRTGSFWFYVSFHCLLGLPAVWLISGRVELAWLAGLLAAINTVAILGNADIKVAGLTLAPLAKIFGDARTRVESELRDLQNAWSLEMRDEVSALPLGVLEGAWLSVHTSVLGADKAQHSLDSKKVTLTNPDALRLALADEMIATNPVYVKRKIERWRKAALRQAGS